MSNLANVKKGDTLVLLGFTGIRLSEVTVAAATKSEITVDKANGDAMVFSRKTGKQTNCVEGKEKYANTIVLPEDAPKPKKKATDKKADKPADKKTSNKKPSKPVDDEDEDEDEDEEEAPKPKTSKTKGAAKPKKPAKVEEDDEDDEDEYEEV